MAVAFESVATTAFAEVASGGTLTITKPTGLAVGDIMVAHLSAIVASGSNANWDTLSGWTLLTNTNQNANANSEARLTTFYKVADSSDASATNFTFTTNTNAAMVGGAIYRISGGAFVTGAATGVTDDTTPTFPNTLTPTFANSLLLFLTTVGDATQTTGSVSGYSITTSNPTWTERYDFTGDISARRGAMAGATATRPEVTATGDSTCTYVNYSQNSVGAIVAISPTTSVSASPATVVSLTISVNTPNGSITQSPPLLTLTLTLNSPTATVTAHDWSNTSKNSVSFSNTSKNVETFTNVSKNNSSWTNTQKS